MKYGLARIVIGSSSFVEISMNEYNGIKDAIDGLIQCTSLEEKFDFVIENYIELEMAQLESAVHHMVRRDADYFYFQEAGRLFNRRLMNFLTTGKAYEDHAKQHICKLFSRKSEECIRITNALDNNDRLEFRAMKEFRRFAQHRGAPIHGENYDSRWDEQRSKLRFTVNTFLKPSELEKDRKSDRKTVDELKALGDNVDLKRVIREYLEGLWDVHDETRRCVSEKVGTWESTLNAAIERFKFEFPDEGSIVGIAAVIRVEDGIYKEQLPFHTNFIEYRGGLVKKNTSLQNISRRYVSSEII